MHFLAKANNAFVLSLIIIVAQVTLANSGIFGIVHMSQFGENGPLKIKGYIIGLPAGKMILIFFF